MASAAPLLLVLDGNSLLHRAYHAAASEGLLDAAGRPVWALRGMVGYLARAAAHLRPDGLVVGFDCPDTSARRIEFPGYKAHRPDKPADLTEQLAGAPALLQAAGITTVVPAGYEADDVLASSAAQARRDGWRTVLMTSDRDAFALIDDTTHVLRVRNGGFDEAELIDAATLTELYGVRPSQYRDFAALRGDPSDNLPGIRRFGASTAAKLMQAFGSVEDAWAADGATLRATVGDLAAAHFQAPSAHEVIDRNRQLMQMRSDLPIPAMNTTRLPLNFAVFKRALLARGINFGPSLWALTGGAAPAQATIDATPELRPWVFRTGLVARRDPTPGQLSLF